ncbi:MAG: chitobiase/beta-hexosaminidase C-terminal domain-containing protein [Bacteroidales bacterium]|nr:chitobiase/beta-hexosaminidase C-terminal domain-containing protein [Bacteroidales bacterium]
MKTLKYFSLVFLMLFSVRVMAQNEIKMHTGSVNIGEGKTYYFFDSGGEEEMTVAEDPENNYRWKTWYSHNEAYTLTFKVPENSTKGIMVTFSSLLINDDSLIIYEGAPGDSNDLSKRIVALTTTNYSTAYPTFSVMSHGNMNIRFRSNSQYRDAGWIASVKLEDFAPQKPIALKEACANSVHILPTSIGEIHYTIDGSEPTASSTKYTAPFTISDITMVKAIAVANNVNSATFSGEFNTETTKPDKQTITRLGNNKIELKANKPNNLNDTWYVRFAFNNDDPTGTTRVYEAKDDTIIELTQPCTLRVVTRPTVCPTHFSDEDTAIINVIYVPAPEITITGSGENDGAATITSSFSGATIYYTISGAEPSTDSASGSSPINLTNLAAGTTVKAIAVVDGDGFEHSAIASNTYIPGGDGNSGVFGGVVLLDDREDHSWCYYSDKTNPIRSLNPADVKITYFGNGTNNISTTDGATPADNSWTQSATGVQVSYNETENQFIYLKTLERTDGTTATSVENAKGRCEYTTIPNPFSKRPTYGSGDTRWRGFYGWRIKSIRGGKIYSAATGGMEYTAYTSGNLATTNMLNAETTYYFAPDNEIGMEVELEALWARAYVTTGTSNMNTTANSYERNFHVITSNNTTASNLQKSYPLTISSRYPNGDNGGGSLSGAFSAAADTKFENIAVSSATTSSWSGNGHNFIVGRGVSGTISKIYGLTNGTGSSSDNYNFIVESGTYGDIYLARQNGTFTGKVTSILGSDYDRAKNTNTLLKVNNNVYLGYGATIGSSSNIGAEAMYCTVKSGNYDFGTYGVDNQFYISSPNGSVFAKRTLIIEGGLFSDIAGGIEANSSIQNIGDHEMINMRFKGGTIKGAVFGAAQYSGSGGHRRFVITGGDFAGWIAGGCNGTNTDGGELYGNTYIYFGGNAQCNSNGSNTTIGPGQATGGNIFGAGSGNSGASGDNATVGRVNSSTIVIADEAIVERDVYGGGNYGYVRNGENNKSDIYVLGGEVKGSVFGGSNMQKGQNVNITMNNGVVGNVYGGSNTQGTINYNVAVNITGGQVKGNVFGGGYGENTNVAGNVEVTIGGTNPQDTPTIAGDVYGGGALGKVNTTAASNTTHVTVNAGTMNNVYGGGLGMKGTDATTYTVYLNWSGVRAGGLLTSERYVSYTYTNEFGNTVSSGNVTSGSNATITVQSNTNITLTTNSSRATITARYNNQDGQLIGTVNDNTITRLVDGSGAGSGSSIAANVGTVTVDIKGGNMIKVFGCNNLNGAPQGTVTVNFDGGEAVDVYGGGNLADYLPNPTLFPTVNITGGKVTNSVYGGGAFAKVNKTIVNMTDGEAGSVYAGAQGDDKNKKLVNYNKTVNMQGGTAIMVYGGSFTCLDSAKSFVNISGGRVKTHVFGSGYFGDMKGDCYVYIGKNAITSAPHSGENGDKFTTTLSDEKPIWIESNVYAGANWGSFQGTFGEATITGASNIYIDGEGYDMAHGKSGNYMIIGGSVYGSGTSCAAGTTDHSVIVRNYGNMTYPSMTRSLRSIQRVSKLILDNSNIDFIGQGDISSMDPTVEYGIINIDTVYAANANNMSLSKPMDNVNKLGSYTCADVYAATPSFTPNDYDKPKAENNGIVINNGGYLMVRYLDNTANAYYYGELQGYFNMREPGDDAGINNEGYIFARPKIIKGNGESYVEKENTQFDVFATDGGFVDFDASTSDTARNTFDVNGNKVRNRKRVEGPAIQMPYTNRVDGTTLDNRSTEADNNTEYRFWRFEPDTVPTVTREVVFVVKADKDASPTSDKFLTTTGSVLLPPSLGNSNKYKIVGLTWGADGKDCNPANITKTETTAEWKYYEGEGVFKTTNDSTENNTLEEYYANPNSTFGFLMRFKGGLKEQEAKILDNNSYENYFKDGHALAEVDSTNTTELPELDFLVTYSDRLSQNEMWAEARMVIDEVDENGNVKQRIYLNISVTTVTKFGQNVETYVYASTAGTKVSTYTAQLNLPTFALADNTKFYATFKVARAEITSGFGTTGNISIVNFGTVSGTKNLALQFGAANNEDNTNGWYNKGIVDNPNQGFTFDFNKNINGHENDSLLGAADGRKYTTIAFDLQYDPVELKKVPEFAIGQKYLGDLIIHMEVDNIEGGITSFDIIVHVYVTGPTKFYYLDGVAGKDGNNGMFPDKAKKTLNGVLNASGFTSSDPIFVVNGVEPKSGATLTWNADKFLNSVTVPEEDKDKYTEEQLRQLSQVKVYRYPGSHPKEDGDTSSTNDFYNGMFCGQMVNVPAGTQFTMHNVCLSGGSDLDTNSLYNPNKAKSPNLHADYPLINIAKGATVSIDNSSLVYNKNTSTTAIAGAIYNEGDLTIDGVSINNNISVAENGRGAGVYFKDGSMKLGNTAAIIIADQVYLYDQKIMEAPHGELYKGSNLSNILVYHDAHPTPIDAKYSGRVIVRYTGTEPSAPKAPFWKTLVNGVPQNQSSILKNHKAAEDSYESDKYGLNTTEMIGFEKANGGDENVLPYITDEMKAETYAPITSNDIIVYSTKANLPVELLYFTAECMGEATQLQWSTASETNNEYFTIERSSNAVNYEEVARIQGAGTTSQRSDYSFMVDNNSTAITYYRLRQTDIDGKYEIFAPIAIQCQNNKAATEISIYPVPANDQVNIFSSNSPMTRIEIYSIMGAKVAEEPAEGNQTTLHIGNLATGVYAVKVFTEDGQVSNVRLIKK